MNTPPRKPFYKSDKLKGAVIGTLTLLAGDPPPFEWATKIAVAVIWASVILGIAHEGAANAQAPNIAAGGDVTVNPPENASPPPP